MEFEYCGVMPKIHKRTYIAKTAQIIGNVTIGEHSSVWYGAVIRGDDMPITIGIGSNIQDNSVLHITPPLRGVSIGDYVSIGHSSIIHGCNIGDNCLIGMGSIIMDGAIIGDNTVIGAGSIVTENKEIPSGVLALGRPAKVIRTLTEDELKGIKNNAFHYIEKIF